MDWCERDAEFDIGVGSDAGSVRGLTVTGVAAWAGPGAKGVLGSTAMCHPGVGLGADPSESNAVGISSATSYACRGAGQTPHSEAIPVGSESFSRATRRAA
jgi:hypothetical protein